MGSWLELVGINLLALLAGVAYGPVYVVAGRIRTWTLRLLFLIALVAQALHFPGVPWFLVLWTSFGVGARIRRRIEQPSRGPVSDGELHP